MNADFFTNNRDALLKKLNYGSLVVITGYGEMQKSADSAHPYQQEANFWYLTGISSPGWWLILDGLSSASYLVSPEIDEVKEVFDGSLTSQSAKKISGVTTVLDKESGLRQLRDFARRHSIVYTTEQPAYIREHAGFQLNTAQHDLRKTLERTFKTTRVCNAELSQLRSIKQTAEIAMIEKAISVTKTAFLSAKKMLETKSSLTEYQLSAIMTYDILHSGSQGHAYSPIIASGKSACTLHYTSNNQKIAKRNLVLLDVGAQWNGYCADITRTYAFGKPTARQQQVHTAVLTAQQACISLLKPGLKFSEYEKQVEQIMKSAIQSLGLSEEMYRQYFPHAIGHGLGIDVHDVMSGYDELQSGMVLTVEPGIYIRDEGIGVRIEDDILITEKGHRNLSVSLDRGL